MSVTVVLALEGLGKMVQNLAKSQHVIGSSVEKGLIQAGWHLRTKSLQLVPRESGELAKSIRGPVNIGPKGMKADVVVSYGNAKVDYAVWVHEIRDPPIAHGQRYNMKHAYEISKGLRKKKSPLEQWKFLEEPLRTERKQLFKIIADEIKKTP